MSERSSHRTVSEGAVKIFGIGLSRTGTTSLTAALRLLGIRTSHYPYDLQTQVELFEGDGRLALLRDYQAVTDISIVPFYRKLDRAYPRSRFILTTRDVETWLASIRWHISGLRDHWDDLPRRFREFTTVISEAVYGSLDFDEARFRDAFQHHHAQVLEYFADRPDDLLVVDIAAGGGWAELCDFLGTDCPDQPFPHANVASTTWREFTRWKRREESFRGDLRSAVPLSERIALADAFALDDAILSDYRIVCRGARFDPDGGVSIAGTAEAALSAGARWLVVAWTSPAFDLIQFEGLGLPLDGYVETKNLKVMSIRG